MTTKIKALLGPSPLTTILGWLSRTFLLLVLYIATTPNALTGIVPPDKEAMILKIALLCYAILGFAKDKATKQNNVTGNGSLYDPYRSGPQTPPKNPPTE